MKRVTTIMAALAAAAVAGSAMPAGAQAVYKCADGVYSDKACSQRVMSTYDAPAPMAPRVREGVSRRLPGETVAEFDVRRRRAHLKETDRDECARLDKRLAFEHERTKTNNEDEVLETQAALEAGHRRHRQLGC